MGLLGGFSWGYSREAELERDLHFWRNRASELNQQLDADLKRAYTEFKAAYDQLRAWATGKERALAISRAELYEERERVAALEDALKRADEQLAERAVAGSFAIGESAPDDLVVAADDVADAVRGVARALKAASEALVGSKKGSSDFWASAIGRDNLRELRLWLESITSAAALRDNFCSASYALPSLSCFAEPKEERRMFSELAEELRQLPVHEAAGDPEVRVVRKQTAEELATLLRAWLRHPDGASDAQALIEHDGVHTALTRLAVKCVIFHALSRATRAPVELIRRRSGLRADPNFCEAVMTASQPDACIDAASGQRVHYQVMPGLRVDGKVLRKARVVLQPIEAEAVPSGEGVSSAAGEEVSAAAAAELPAPAEQAAAAPLDSVEDVPAAAAVEDVSGGAAAAAAPPGATDQASQSGE